MTIEEAIEIIEDLKYSLDISLTGTSEINEIDNAITIAIKSLETWEKVKEEIDNNITIISTNDTYEDGIKVGLIKALDIINKHMEEVSE